MITIPTAILSLSSIASYIAGSVYSIWHYTVTIGGNPIAVSSMIVSIVLFLLGLKLAKYMSLFLRDRLLKALDVEESVANSLEKISYYSFIILITLFVLQIANIPLTIFTFVGGALVIGIGFGSQNIINNFISGLIIMVERPIKLGDIIEINNVIGQVTNIGARCVSVKSGNNINMLVPNSYILQNNIINWTLEERKIRTSYLIYVEHQSPIEKVEEILCQALKNNQNIIHNPAPQVYLSDLGRDGIGFEMEFWINLSSKVERKRIFSDLNKTIVPQFAEHNINIAVPWTMGQSTSGTGVTQDTTTSDE